MTTAHKTIVDLAARIDAAETAEEIQAISADLRALLRFAKARAMFVGHLPLAGRPRPRTWLRIADVGEKKIQVIKTLRAYTRLPLKEAKLTSEGTKIDISALDDQSQKDLMSGLAELGAVAVIESTGLPPAYTITNEDGRLGFIDRTRAGWKVRPD